MELLGAVKIQDGLFLGDEYAAQVIPMQDLEFVVANKVSHIINASARQVPNHWEPIGVQYVDLFWMDHDVQQLLDAKDELPATLCSFIAKALSLGESVLIHSVKGQNRSLVIVLLYLMRTYAWTLAKALEFVATRRPNLNPRQSFIAQVQAFEGRLQRHKTLSVGWDRLPVNPEETVLRNTFLNSKVGKLAETVVGERREKHSALQWMDGGSGQGLIDVPRPTVQNRIENGFVMLRSCLKGGRNKGERKVPLGFGLSPRRRGFMRKTDGFREIKSMGKQEDKPTSSTAEDLLRPKKPLFDSSDGQSDSPKKPRALSAGSKDQKARPSAMKALRTSLYPKPATSQPTLPRTSAIPQEKYMKSRAVTAPNPSKPKGKGFSRSGPV